jgi:hypothetical protein
MGYLENSDYGGGELQARAGPITVGAAAAGGRCWRRVTVEIQARALPAVREGGLPPVDHHRRRLLRHLPPGLSRHRAA